MGTLSAETHYPSSSLPSGEVHLWHLTDALPYIGPVCAGGFVLLSPEEKQRFVDIKIRTVARRFLLGRILLRRVLARYLDEDPAALAFHYNPRGKPELSGLPATRLSFNLSHSASEIVLAVTRSSAIGVDIEPKSRAGATHRISKRFFSKNEIRDLNTLRADAPKRALMLWSLKESIVKANGDTVWDGLAKLSLSIDDRRIIWASSKKSSSSNWQLVAGPFQDDYILACAVKSLGDQPNEPLIFRTSWLGTDSAEKHGFEPLYST